MQQRTLLIEWLPKPSRDRQIRTNLSHGLHVAPALHISGTASCGGNPTRGAKRERARERESAMELKIRAVVVAMAMVLLLVAASTTAAAGQSLCKMTQEGLAACKPCIATVKPEEKPSEACCAALKQADLPCLCSYKNSDLLPYLGIDPKQAMQLPVKCNIAPPQPC
ncbi:unnamed protein product [Musa textilis]